MGDGEVVLSYNQLMKDLDLKILGENIEKVFLEQDKYVFEKKVTEFNVEGKFVGDIINFLMFDPSTTPPTFYEVSTPFDLVSKKAPQHALVYRDGKCVFQADYTEYAAMRTGIMDALILSHTHKASLGDKKVLLFGSGKTATWSIKGMAALTPEIKSVDYYTLSGRKETFEAMGKEQGIELQYTENWREVLPSYDIITCHTRTEEPFLLKGDISNIKQGAQIHSFITSTEHGELADAFYTKEVDLVSDWPKILGYNKILMRAVENKQIDPEKIVYLKVLFGGSYRQNEKLPYTIVQMGGTPIQNLAVLQLLTT